MTGQVHTSGLTIDRHLWQLVNEEILPGTGLSIDGFWTALAQIVDDLGPKNRALLLRRDHLQAQIDQWHRHRQGLSHDPIAYRAFLRKIGYLVDEGDDFEVTTRGVDEEVATQAGPQLVVPVKNARFALNAANARWGSLYDALYGSDAISENRGAQRSRCYNPLRGARVIAFAKHLLDQAFPLQRAGHYNVIRYRVVKGALILTLDDDSQTQLAQPEKFIGYQGCSDAPSAVLLKNHHLHIEIQIDPRHPVGRRDNAGVKDLLMEAAVTTIMDCEDSVAAVDAQDKVEVYRNWLKLMQGNLTAKVTKGSRTHVRTLNSDRHYTTPDNGPLLLPGRSLLFIRNVGHLMTSNAVLDKRGQEIPEGILDGMVTALGAIHDLKGHNHGCCNSRAGSIYIVKPKMHGPDEVAFTCELLSRIEDALGLSRDTIKLGIMDEERRTTLNLKECIRVAKERLAFINTGFLDRTGDEIHTSMFAGPLVAKGAMKQQAWLRAYESWNVDTGLQCGLVGKAQIGKGMWPMPDEMALMLEQKIAHPRAGANTAWVPSPTAATLHAIHYHQVDVRHRQLALTGHRRALLEDLLAIPLIKDPTRLTAQQIECELDNNVQSILGYVVRWIDRGIGCSKVPNINHVALMEDRATLRIASQQLANWLLHGLCTPAQVQASLERMATVVDQQNANDPAYLPMAPAFNGIAFNAASELIFKGRKQPSGYTEPLLHAYRVAAKNRCQ